MTRTALFFAGLMIAGTATAQDKTDRELEVRYQEVTEIDFRTLDVEGTLVKPQIGYINPTTGAEFESLIKPRVDFKPEMRRSVDLVK